MEPLLPPSPTTTTSTPRCQSKRWLETFQSKELIFVTIHIFFLITLFSPGLNVGFGSSYRVPPVWYSNNELSEIDHLRFNLQWTVVIWSLYLYPAIIADLLPVRNKKILDTNRGSWPKWLKVISKSDDAMIILGLINAVLGFTTIGSYIYQTYEHAGNDWFGSDPQVRSVTNVTLCFIDMCIDFIALGFVGAGLLYIPLAHQRLDYLTSTDTMFLTLGASSNLVYCLQIFYEFLNDTKSSPDPHTLTFFRIFPIVSFVNWIAPRYLVTSKEQWSVYEVYLKLVATCIVVAGLMVTTERLGNPTTWDPTEDEESSWTFFKSLWFVVVTTSTVGYGDFSTSTFFGRVSLNPYSQHTAVNRHLKNSLVYLFLFCHLPCALLHCSIAHCSLLIAHCSLLIAHCSLLCIVVHCSFCIYMD